MPDAAREIENLLYVYAERVDAGDFEGVAELFAHGRILGSPDAGPDTTWEGRERVLELYRASVQLHAGSPRTRHVTTNAIIEIDDDAQGASARSSYLVFQQVGDAPLQPIVCGRYDDRFQRIDGRWCFDTRIMIVDHAGDLRRHLRYALA